MGQNFSFIVFNFTFQKCLKPCRFMNSMVCLLFDCLFIIMIIIIIILILKSEDFFRIYGNINSYKTHVN